MYQKMEIRTRLKQRRACKVLNEHRHELRLPEVRFIHSTASLRSIEIIRTRRLRQCLLRSAPLASPQLDVRQKIMKNGKDKGFCFLYFDLSYRRKFIRTLWMIPFCLLPLRMPENAKVLGIEKSIWIVLILVSLFWQLIYTYKKWNAIERDGNTPFWKSLRTNEETIQRRA